MALNGVNAPLLNAKLLNKEEINVFIQYIRRVPKSSHIHTLDLNGQAERESC